MLQNEGVLYILTYKFASRHSGVPFLDIGSSKSAPYPAPQRRTIFPDQIFQNVHENLNFPHFDLQMCFAPQRHTIFRHLQSKKRSGIVVFCAFWLQNAHRATAACHFSGWEVATSVPEWGFLYSLTCKCASRHSEAQFFICLLNSYLRTRRFSEPTFRTSGTTNHWKNTAIRDVPNIWRACSFFLVTWHACWSSFCWLDISTLLFNSAAADLTSLVTPHVRWSSFSWLDISTLLFNSAAADLTSDLTSLVTLRACWSSFCWLDVSTLLFKSADLTSLLCFSTLHIVGS